MDRDRFDRLSRLVAAGGTRRDALRLLLGGAAVSAAASIEGASARNKRHERQPTRVRAQQNATCPNTCNQNCSTKKLQGGANLSACNFDERDLDGVNLRSANLSKACFADASLRGADLRSTNVSGACFCGADLTGADFRGSNITTAQLACATVACTTILPNGKPATNCACPVECPPGSVCELGGCQPCTVSCPSGDGVACGNELIRHMALDQDPIYICPGRYIGNFRIFGPRPPLVMIGAGDGDNPATSTILDANFNGRVLLLTGEDKLTLQRVRIANGLSGEGSGILNRGTLDLSDSTVVNNTSTGISAGGGIQNDGRLTITRSTVTRNRGNSGGGILSSGPLTITGSTISRNTGDEIGGGIAVFSAAAIKDSVITGNDSRRGGGLYNRSGGGVTFDRTSSITGNSSFLPGGGIFNIDSQVFLNGATVSGNTPDNCAGPVPVAGCNG
ncbi:MAG: pentapeptide repeat-containing protein [Thermomicrobiales bacterium]